MRYSCLCLIFLLPLFSLVQSAPTTSLQERDLNAFLAQITALMPFSGFIQDISGVLGLAIGTLGSLFGIKSTQNDLSGSCAAVTVIFARGTSEPGNVGVLVGPPFFDALKSKIGAGNVAVQGVAYPASVEGFLLGGDAGGAQTMAKLVTQAFSKCPNTKIVMGGYSQGGQLVHKAAQLLPAATMQAVKSVVIFGDPDNGEGVQNAPYGTTLVVCHPLDDICYHGDFILLDHLTYASNADQAARFVASKCGY